MNHRVSLSTRAADEYQWETRAEGRKMSGSSSEPTSLRTAITYRYSRRTFIEPSLTVGLNDNAPDFLIGISMSRRFGN